MGHEIILCVDDDSSVLMALRSLLGKRLNHAQSIEIAESGEEALELVDELVLAGDELVAVIADYIMPGMKGDELLIQIHARAPKAITIMLTGQSDLSGVKRAINEAHLFRFLEKPWYNEDLLLTLQAAQRAYELDRELQRQNQALRQLNEALEQTVADRTRELREKNTLLERLAITDRLTGLYNRLYLDEVLQREYATAARHGTHFSIILLDVDLFKQVNDTYGHHVGDEVLETISALLKSRARASDIVGRWGGEEFLIICPNTELAAATTCAELLRARIEAQDFPVVGCRTASFGVATFHGGDTVLSIEARADQALYQAKARGRNCVVASE